MGPDSGLYNIHLGSECQLYDLNEQQSNRVYLIAKNFKPISLHVCGLLSTYVMLG